MPQISLTTFNDFALAQGAAKLTVVRNALRQYEDKEYDPKTDYWRRLRRHIRQVHMSGGSKSDLDALTDLPPSKERQYEESLREYKRWWGRKELEWFDPPASPWSYEQLTVRVNPELGLLVNGEPHLVKLYFKKEPIYPRRLA